MQSLRRSAALLAVALLLLGGAARAQNGFYLKDGDRVVFYGDSITDQRLYTTFAETFVVTRFPNLNVSFVHSGWGGDRVSGGGGGPIDVRLKRDVIAYRPTVMTVMLGMNDGGYRPFDEALYAAYTTGYERILKTVRAALPGLRLTLIQPSPYDDVTRAPGFEGGYNGVLRRYSRFVADLAQRQGLAQADLNAPVVAALQKANAADPETARRIVPDRVHPGPGGHLLMAGALLRAWNAPAVVTAVEIDAPTLRATRADNTVVTDLNGSSYLTWRQADSALPMPVDFNDPIVNLAVRSSDFMETLNQQPLKVTGLTGPGYTLKIDGQTIGTFSKEQLAAGINLAALTTPMAKQAIDVHALTILHNQVHFARWRQVQVPFEREYLHNLQRAIEALDDLEAEVVRRQRAAARPKLHRYELTPLQ